MRFLRFLCNLGIFLVAFIVINTIGILSFDVISWGVSGVDSIHIVTKDNSKINFWDGYDFTLTDMDVNLDQAPKPYVRNIFGGKGLWADKALNFVLGLTKPLIFSHAQLDNLAENRTSSIYEDLFLDYSYGMIERHNLNSSYVNDKERIGAFIELASFSDVEAKLLGVASIEKVENSITIITKTNKTIVANISKIDSKWIAEIDFNGTIFTHEMFTEKNIDYVTAKSSKVFDDNYTQWAIRGNDLLATRYWLSHKYNDERYDKFISKFFVIDASNNDIKILVDVNKKPVLKPEGMFLFICQFMAFILAIIFAVKYPVSIIQARVTSRRRRRRPEDGGAGIVI